MSRKWNNQGGSNFDAFSGKYKKPKEQPNIPKFEDLRESNTTSFNYKIPPKPQPQLGAFGDEIWTYDAIEESPPINPFVDLTPKDPRIPRIPEIIPLQSIPKVDPVNSSTDLFPFNVTNEYELVVKFGLLVLRISSGQSYAARQMINDPKYDFAIVIKSSNAISLCGNTASTVNLISVSNSAQNPIYSLYNWLKTKLNIATNNDATGSDPVLSGIDIVDGVAQLPSTQFISNSLTCGLFYAEGIQPDQICLNATNKVFKFEPSRKDDPTWVVTYPGEILPLCLDIVKLQIVSIKLIPPELSAIARGSGQQFVIRIARDATIAQLASSLEVDIQITSDELLPFSQQLDPALYTTTNINDVAIGQISATIPSLAEFIDITIEPLADNTKEDPVPLKVEIIGSWVPDSTPDYKINELFSEVNMTVNPPIVVKPTVTLMVDRSSTFPQDTPDGVFNVVLSIDMVLTTALSVNIQFDGTAVYSDFTVNGNPVSSNILVAVIPAGQTTYQIAIKPNLTPVFNTSRTIIPSVLASIDYIGTPDLTLEVTRVPLFVRIKTMPAMFGDALTYTISERTAVFTNIGEAPRGQYRVFYSTINKSSVDILINSGLNDSGNNQYSYSPDLILQSSTIITIQSVSVNGVNPNDSVLSSYLSVASIDLYRECNNCINQGYDYIYFTTLDGARQYSDPPSFYPASYQEARNGFISCQVAENLNPLLSQSSSFASKYVDMPGTAIGYLNYQSVGRVTQQSSPVSGAASVHTITNAVVKINATTFEVSFVPVTLVANTPSNLTTTISNRYIQQVFL